MKLSENCQSTVRTVSQKCPQILSEPWMGA
nr:MAG TPA: hypothetical protein [Caudoviricetes sp.]